MKKFLLIATLTCSYMSSAQTPTVEAKPYEWVPVWDSVISVNAPSSSTPVDPDLVAFWKYNEPSGTTAASEVNGMTLTAYATNPAIGPGVEGNSRAGGNAMYRNLPTECDQLRGELTVDGYVNMSSFGGSNQGWFAIDPAPGGTRNEVLAIYISSQGLYAEYIQSNGIRQNYQTGYATLVPNSWNRLSVVRKSMGGTSYQLRFYSHGNLIGTSSTFPLGAIACIATQGFLTGAGSGGFNMVIGNLDYVRVWKRALSDAELAISPEPENLTLGNIACSLSARSGTGGGSVTYPVTFTATCPTGCNSGYGAVYGTGPYTDDSSICASAIHAGKITAASGGPVTVITAAGLTNWPCNTQNGITTNCYPFLWNNGFNFQ